MPFCHELFCQSCRWNKWHVENNIIINQCIIAFFYSFPELERCQFGWIPPNMCRDTKVMTWWIHTKQWSQFCGYAVTCARHLHPRTLADHFVTCDFLGRRGRICDLGGGHTSHHDGPCGVCADVVAQLLATRWVLIYFYLYTVSSACMVWPDLSAKARQTAFLLSSNCMKNGIK